MIIGIDIGGTNVRALIVEPEGALVVDRRRASSSGNGPALVATIVGLVDQLVTASHDFDRLNGIGLGVAGLAGRSGTLRWSPNLPEVVEFPLGPELEEKTGLSVTMTNDASAAAWAEHQLGAGRDVDDFAMVTLGTGIGAGFVMGGRLLWGAEGYAGEVGHMLVARDGPFHHTGQQGPWEHFASGTALGRLGREAAAAGHFSVGLAMAESVDDIDGHHVGRAIAAGDPEAEGILEEFCREVALGLSNLVVVLDPSRVVLGGGLSGIGEPLRAGVERWLGEVLPGSVHRPAVEVRLAELGDDAGAIGAALLAAEATAHD